MFNNTANSPPDPSDTQIAIVLSICRCDICKVSIKSFELITICALLLKNFGFVISYSPSIFVTNLTTKVSIN